jgi:cytidyltransferase-like protein
MPKHIVVSGAFDDIRSHHLRFLEEAARLGDLTVLLWPDQTIQAITGKRPKFPEAERLYFLNAVRSVGAVRLVSGPVQPDVLPEVPGYRPDVWVVGDCRANPAKQAHAAARGIEYRVLGGEEMHHFPDLLELPLTRPSGTLSPSGGEGRGERVNSIERVPEGRVRERKKVVVTGCYDWFHSGHVRFFEEVSAYGDLHVIIGHDANIRLLKGEGHPLFPQDERRYLVGSIRFVKQALISSGEGWLDADPEIQRLKPDICAVNEDGDRGGKREYCAKHGLEYLVLKRTPAPGLPQRSSTDLRGF